MRRVAVLVCAALACDDGAAARAYGQRYCESFCPDPMNARCLQCGGSGGGTAGGNAGGSAGGSAGGVAGGDAGGTAGGSAGGNAGGTAGGSAGASPDGSVVADDGGTITLQLAITDGGPVGAERCIPAMLAVQLGGSPVVLDTSYAVAGTVTWRGGTTEVLFRDATCTGLLPTLQGPSLAVWFKAPATGSLRVDLNLMSPRPSFGTTYVDAWAQMSVSRADAGPSFCVSFIFAPVALGSAGDPMVQLRSNTEPMMLAAEDAGTLSYFYPSDNCTGMMMLPPNLVMTGGAQIFSTSIFSTQAWTVAAPYVLPVSLQASGNTAGLGTGLPCTLGKECVSRQCGGGKCLCTQRGGICSIATQCCGDAGCTANHCR